MTTEIKTQATPRPWHEATNVTYNTVKVTAKARHECAIATLWKDREDEGFEERQANANLICLAVNNFEALRAALRLAQVRIYMVDGYNDLYQTINHILRRIEEEETAS